MLNLNSKMVEDLVSVCDCVLGVCEACQERIPNLGHEVLKVNSARKYQRARPNQSSSLSCRNLGEVSEESIGGNASALVDNLSEQEEEILAVLEVEESDSGPERTSNLCSSSEEDIGQFTKPFKVKPLNKPVIPRIKWTETKPPNRVQAQHSAVSEILKGIDDLDIAGRKLQKIVEKNRTVKRQDDLERRKIRKDRLGVRVVSGENATILRKAKSNPKNSHHKPKDHGSKPYIKDYVPQSGLMRNLFSNLGLDPETRDFLEESTDKLQNIKVEHTVNTNAELLNVVKNLTAAIENPKVEVDLGVGVTKSISGLSDFAMFALVAVVILLLKPETQKEKMYAMALVSFLMVSRLDVMALVEKSGLFSFFAAPEQRDVPQMFSDPTGGTTIEELTTIITSMINLYLMKSIGTELLDPKEFLKVTNQISRSTPTVIGTMRGIGLLMSYVTQCLDAMLGRKGAMVKTGFPFIDAFWTEYKDIVELWESRELYNRQESVDRVKAHIALGETIAVKLPGNGTYGSMRMAMFNAIAELTKIRKELMASNFRFAGMRQEPLGLLMMGRPGTFKSQAMQHIAHALSALLSSEEEFARYCKDPNAWVYNRQAENVYWDGYTMDKIVCFFDDILQVRDTQGVADGEAMNIIRAINIFESKLHMAKIEDKGNTSFRSKVVLATTNVENFNLESINEIGAFMRRWEVVVRVTPLSQYASKNAAGILEFDVSKFPKFTEENCRGKTHLIGTTRTHPEMCEFHLMKYEGGKTFVNAGEPPLSFEQLMKLCCERLVMKQKQHEGYNVTLDDTLEYFRSKKTEFFPDVDDTVEMEEMDAPQMRREDASGPGLAVMEVSIYDRDGREFKVPFSSFVDDLSAIGDPEEMLEQPMKFDVPDVQGAAYTERALQILENSERNMHLVLFILHHVSFGEPYRAREHLDRLCTYIEIALEDLVYGDFDLAIDEVPEITVEQFCDILQLVVNPTYPSTTLPVICKPGRTSYEEISRVYEDSMEWAPQGGCRSMFPGIPEEYTELARRPLFMEYAALCQKEIHVERDFMSLHWWRAVAAGWAEYLRLYRGYENPVADDLVESELFVRYWKPHALVRIACAFFLHTQQLNPETFGAIEFVDYWFLVPKHKNKLRYEYVLNNPTYGRFFERIQEIARIEEGHIVGNDDKAHEDINESLRDMIGETAWVPQGVQYASGGRILVPGAEMIDPYVFDLMARETWKRTDMYEEIRYLKTLRLMDEVSISQWTPQLGLDDMGELNVAEASRAEQRHEFDDDFTLDYSRMNTLRWYRMNSYTKYLLIYYGFVVTMKKAFIHRGEELIPHAVFDCVAYLLQGVDGNKYTDGHILEIEKLSDDVYNQYKKHVKKCFRPGAETMQTLPELEKLYRENEDTVIGKIGRFYRDCILYFAVTGSEVSNASLGAMVKSESLRRALGATAFLATGFYIGFKTVKLLASTLFSMMPQSHVKHEKVKRHKKVMRKPHTSRYKPEGALGLNQGIKSNREMIYNNCLYDIWFPKEEEPGTLYCGGMCLSIKGQVVMMPWHFWSAVACSFEDGGLVGDELIVLKRPGRSLGCYALTVEQFVHGAVLWDKGDQQDIIMIKMPKNFPQSRSIAKHFATEKQHSHYTKVGAVLCVPSELEKDDVVTREVCNVTAIAERCRELGDDIHEAYTVDEVYSYDAATSYGDCGGILFVNDATKSGCIIGMHIAGSPSKGRGLSAKLSREFIEEYLKEVDDPYQEEDQLDLELEPTARVMANMTTLGMARPECRMPGSQQESRYVPSLIKDQVFESPNDLAHLKPFKTKEGVRIDPLLKASQGYSAEFSYVDFAAVEDAADSYFDQLEFISKGHKSERKVYDFEHAVLGDGPGSEFKSVPRVTSAGFPYNVQPGLSSKARFFGTGMDYDLDNPECEKLRKSVDHVIAKAKEGVRCMHIFTDSLKDEKLPKHKVEIGKTRMFAAGPTELLIATRMYFGAFSKHCIRNRIDNGIAIGVNEYSSEWDLIGRNLNKFGKGNNKGAGDFSGLDKRQLPIFFIEICRKVNEWYDGTPDDNKVREILLLDLMYSRHVNARCFYEWTMSMPSGHFLTALFNSIAVQLMFRICFNRLTRLPMWDFPVHVYLIVLGDDNVFSVDEQITDMFNEASIGMEMAKLGHIYTSEDKASMLRVKLRSLEEVTFLKRRWCMHYDMKPPRFMAPLELSTILDIPNWRKKGGNELGDVEANIDTVLHELTLHGRKVFDIWSKKLIDVVDKVPGLGRPKNMTYRALLAEVAERDGFSYYEQKMGLDYGVMGEDMVDKLSPGERLAQLPEVESKNDSDEPQSGRAPRNCPKTTSPEIGHLASLWFPQGGATTDTISDVDGLMKETRVDEGNSKVELGMTKSANDGAVREASPMFTPISRELLQPSETGVTADVKQFLGRPAMLQSGSFSSANVANRGIHIGYIPRELFTKVDMWADKVRGFLGFRGNLVLTIQVNGTRFQQGRYMLVWIPTCGAVTAGTEWKIRAHKATLTETTQCPHVEFDINCDTEATLTIPHVTVQNFSFISGAATEAYGNNGLVEIVPYSPLVAATGSVTANYTLFAHWENVELAYPYIPEVTAATFRPQSGRVGRKVTRRPGATPNERELSAASIGPIQTLASRVSLAAQYMGKVPSLSSIAVPVGWAAEVAGNVASSFGWSKPRDQSVVAYVNRSILHKMSNVDTADSGTKLALTDKNELEDLPSLGGTDADEMSINYIAAIPAYFKSVQWTSAQGVDTKLMDQKISPRLFSVEKTLGTATTRHTTPLSFIARMFSLWRCAVKFTFKIVKTEFHSGRLLAVFEPFHPRAGYSNPVNLSNSVYLHRQIIDVREGSEFSITVPFVSVEQYLRTDGPNSHIGNLHLIVLNSLVAPANVSSSVEILIEISADGDAEFAQPYPVDGSALFAWQPQSGRGNTCEIVSGSIGGASGTTSTIASRACIGERILSLRQLLKRYNPVKNRYTSTDVMPVGTNCVSVYPWGMHVDVMSDTGDISISDWHHDLFSEIGVCFGIYRGSMRYKYVTAADDKDVWHASAEPLLTFDATWDEWMRLSDVPVQAPNHVSGRMFSHTRSELSGGIEVEYPYYSNLPGACTADLLMNYDAQGGTDIGKVHTLSTVPLVMGTLEKLPVGGTAYPVRRPAIYRAIGEDGGFSMFISTVPVTGYYP